MVFGTVYCCTIDFLYLKVKSVNVWNTVDS